MPSFKCMREYSVDVTDGLNFTRRAEAEKLLHKEVAPRLLQALSLNKLYTVRITGAYEEIVLDTGVGTGKFIMEVFIGDKHE